VKWTEAKWREVWRSGVTWSEMWWSWLKLNGVKCGEEKWSVVKWSVVKWSEVKGGTLCWGSEGYIAAVKWNEGQALLIWQCNSSWQFVFHYCSCLVYNRLNCLLIAVFITYSSNCSIDGWGATLQAGRSRVRLPIGSLIVFSAPNTSSRTMSPGYRSTDLWGKARPECKSDNLTAAYEPIV
jgi:hypothetical protein